MESQIAKQKSFGDFQKVDKLEKKLQKCKIIKANTRSASITKEEAIYARNHPTLSTAKDVANLSHQAGMNAIGVGALVSGGVSLITNIYECVTKGKDPKGKDPKEALKRATTETLKGGVHSHGIAFGGSLLGGVMQNNANQVIQNLSNGSMPTMVVGVGVKSCRILTKYFRGEINSVELFGGFVGVALSEAFFNALNSKKVELARQRRIEIEKECREHIRQLEMYQNQFKEVFERYFQETARFFNESFDELERALYAGDADLAIGANNKIQEGLGQKPLSNNKQELWELITSNKDIRI
ncbi:hypothetical protein HG563_03010 [Helicobacter pylori]|nr:hypothetical protein HG563_03010 [Helicobacter pylori]